jgi:hypothetical protein
MRCARATRKCLKFNENFTIECASLKTGTKSCWASTACVYGAEKNISANEGQCLVLLAVVQELSPAAAAARSLKCFPLTSTRWRKKKVNERNMFSRNVVQISGLDESSFSLLKQIVSHSPSIGKYCVAVCKYCILRFYIFTDNCQLQRQESSQSLKT